MWIKVLFSKVTYQCCYWCCPCNFCFSVTSQIKAPRFHFFIFSIIHILGANDLVVLEGAHDERGTGVLGRRLRLPDCSYLSEVVL